jgi:hypothetical protein
VWFPAGGILPNEIHLVATTRVFLRETSLLFSSDDLQLVRDEIVPIALSDGTKHHVSVFASLAPPSNDIAPHLCTAPKIEAAIDIVATQLAD